MNVCLRAGNSQQLFSIGKKCIESDIKDFQSRNFFSIDRKNLEKDKRHATYPKYLQKKVVFLQYLGQKVIFVGGIVW